MSILRKLPKWIVLVLLIVFELLFPKCIYSADFIGSWSLNTSLPYQLSNHTAIENNNQLFIVDGSAATGYSHNQIISSDVNLDGSLNPWNFSSTVLPTALIYHSSVKKDDFVYILGGLEENVRPVGSVDKVFLGIINEFNQVASWATTSALLKKLQMGAAVEAGGRIYFAGGETQPGNTWNDKIYMASINPDGTLSSWQEAGTMPQLNKGFGLIEHNGYLIIVGGDGPSGYTDQVYKAKINSGGTLGIFSATTHLPQPLNSEVVKIGNKVVSIAGGHGPQMVLDNIYYADLNDDGSVGEWTESINPLPIASCCQGVAVANGYLFVTGGWAASGYLNTVYSAKLDLATPPPAPVVYPIVLLPGLGGSWNTEAMISGSTGGTWKKTPFIKVYDNLKDSFLSLPEYIENDTYFEFYYDWRQPLEDLADQLDEYINKTVLAGKPAGTKVNLVGHSMGGMVARTYAQNHGLDKINKLVTSGSPHQGAIKAWMGWSGAEIGERWSWEWIGLQLYLQIHKAKYASPVTAVRDLAPGLSNLIPTFDFAKDKFGQILAVTGMSGFNSYLDGLNTSISSGLKDLMTTISGKEQVADKDTVEWIKLTDRTLTDKLLGKWSDGKPDSFEYTPDGDLTVLKKSALINDTNITTVDASHVELVETTSGIQAILNALGLTASPVTTTSEIPRNPSLVFFLHSPATLKVIAPDGLEPKDMIVSEADKLVIVYNALPGDYTVEVIGTGTGSYHLEIGRLTEEGESWDQVSNQTTNGQKDSWQLSVDQGSKPGSLNLAKDKLNQLKLEVNQSGLTLTKKRNIIVYINQVIRLIDRGNNSKYIQAAVNSTYVLRQKVDKFGLGKIEWKNLINEIGEILIQAYLQTGVSVNSKTANQQIKGADKMLSQVRVKIEKKFSGENEMIGAALSMAESYFDQAKEKFNDKEYSEAFIRALVSRIISQETGLMVK